LVGESGRYVFAGGGPGALVGEESLVFGCGDEGSSGWFGVGAVGEEMRQDITFEADEDVFDAADLMGDAIPELPGTVRGPGAVAVFVATLPAGWGAGFEAGAVGFGVAALGFEGESVEVVEVGPDPGGGSGEGVDLVGEEVDVPGGHRRAPVGCGSSAVGGAGDEGGHGVGGVAVEGDTVPVVAASGAWVAVAGGFLDVAERCGA
jgi:hypothetical protein